uniref:Uncharacterized protein n=1 Tax=Amphimedon queenslandica TaxID=400682 RepID=A0A1X7UCV1_AMPQE
MRMDMIYQTRGLEEVPNVTMDKTTVPNQITGGTSSTQKEVKSDSLVKTVHQSALHSEAEKLNDSDRVSLSSLNTITQFQSSDEKDQEHCICKSGENEK